MPDRLFRRLYLAHHSAQCLLDPPDQSRRSELPKFGCRTVLVGLSRCPMFVCNWRPFFVCRGKPACARALSRVRRHGNVLTESRANGPAGLARCGDVARRRWRSQISRGAGPRAPYHTGWECRATGANGDRGGAELIRFRSGGLPRRRCGGLWGRDAWRRPVLRLGVEWAGLGPDLLIGWAHMNNAGVRRLQGGLNLAAPRTAAAGERAEPR